MAIFNSFLGIDGENRPMLITNDKLNPEGDLLFRIQAMPKRQPISLRTAWYLTQEDFSYQFFESKNMHVTLKLISQHWVDHASELGFHIVLDGSEYETNHKGPKSPVPQRRLKS